METLGLVGLIAGAIITYIVAKYTKANEIISNLSVRTKKEDLSENTEIAKQIQEVENARINYKTARDVYNQRIADSNRSK